jgi:hypothetical protein
VRPKKSLAAFRKFAAQGGFDLDNLGAAASIELMTSWYNDVRFDGVDIAEEGDMLLFEWSTQGEKRPMFRYAITRQLIDGALDDDPEIWQLHLELRFTGTPETAAFGSGEQWCDTPAGLDDFRARIDSAPATRFAQSTSPKKVHVGLELAE